MKHASAILAHVDRLIAEGEALLNTKFTKATSSFTKQDFVPVEAHRRWRGNCAVLHTFLGRAAQPWGETLLGGSNSAVSVMGTLGTLRSVKDAVEGDHLVTFASLVVAEAFTNLIEQAEYLLSKGYWLAAGVLARAVLEEDLRNLAQSSGCLPEKDRATLGDLNAALYKAEIYDKLEFKLIDTLAAVGNDCAHNTSSAKADRVRYFLEQLVALLPRLQ